MFTVPESSAATHFFYEIGGFRVSLDSFSFHESEYLAAFRTECRQGSDLRMTIRQVPSIAAPEEIAVERTGETVFQNEAGQRVRICLNERKDAILYQVTERSETELLAEITPKAASQLGSYLILRWLDLPNRFLKRSAVFLHASFIRWKGKAILFTGIKQIGKSTQAELWRRSRGAEVMNGDRALLRKTDGVWTACGSPFCGTSGICRNEEVPIAAIVLLKKGPNNRTEPVSLKDATVAFLSGCTFNTMSGEATEQVMKLAKQIHSEVSMFRLTCTPDERAVQCLERQLCKEGDYG
jgi:hypothetical protein